MTIRDPEYFRGMAPGAMLQTLILDAADERHKQAQAAGAKCHRCLDAGLDAGQFCGCPAGRKLATQATKAPAVQPAPVSVPMMHSSVRSVGGGWRCMRCDQVFEDRVKASGACPGPANA